MPEKQDSLIQHVDSFNGLKNQVYGNIPEGSQFGIGPRLGYIDSVTPVIFPNAIIITTHSPTMFDNIPFAKNILCALFESAAQKIDNIEPEVTVSELSGPKLQNKQTMKVPGSSGIADMNPSFTWPEVPGNLVHRFFMTWVKMMSHFETGFSQLGSIFKSDSIPPFIYSYYTADILVIQPDITLQPQNIIDAYFLCCMWPKNAGGALGVKREIGGDHEVKERTVEFSSVLQWNANTYKVGQTVLDLLNMHRLNFDYGEPVSLGVEDKLKDSGVTKTLEEMKAELVET